MITIRHSAQSARLIGACALAAAVLLTGCGEGSRPLPSLTGSPSLPSVSAPTPSSIPTRTRTRSQRPTASPSETETVGPTTPPTKTTTPSVTSTPPETPSHSPTATETDPQTPTTIPTATPTTPTPTASAASSEPEAAAPADATAGSSWLWLLALGGLALLGGLGWVLVRNHQRRARWDADITEARSEAQWVLAQLVPAASSQSSEQWRGGWTVARPRVLGLDERLVGLAASAPDQARTATASTLLAAVRATSAAMQRLAEQPDDTAQIAMAAAAQALAQAARDPATAASPGNGTEQGWE